MTITEEIDRIAKEYNLDADVKKEMWYVVDCTQKEMINRFNKIKIQDQFIIDLAREIK